MTKRSNSIAFWAGIAVFLVAVLAMTQTVRNEYPFFAGYVILQFIVLSVAWSILGGYAGYVNFGTNAFFGIGVYTAVALFKASRIDGEIERFAGGGRVFAKVPQAQTVVAIDGLDNIGLGIELHAHLAEIVAQQHADLTADRWVLKAWNASLEHPAALDDKTVIVGVGGIKQSSSQPSEQRRSRGDAGGHGNMVGRPLPA